MRSLLVGLDAFDPVIAESLLSEGRLPNLEKLSQIGGYREFSVSTPPQSEVSWTSIATGQSPESHGLFDFVHRNPNDYSLFLSLLPTTQKFGSEQFTRPFTRKTLFSYAAERGYQATALWWPAMFPAQRQLPIRTIPGLGTPDLLGRWGVGAFFSNDKVAKQAEKKIPVNSVERVRYWVLAR